MVSLLGRTFELRKGNVRVDRFREETGLDDDDDVVVTVVGFDTYMARLLILIDTSRFGFFDCIKQMEMNETSLWKEIG